MRTLPCERCDRTHWSEQIVRVTLEHETEDGEIISKDMSLCPLCRSDARRAGFY